MNTIDKIVEELMKMECCKVCQCENGKRIWCTCHRKQIKTSLQKVKDKEREEIVEMAEGMTRKLLGSVKKNDEWRSIYNTALYDLITKIKNK